MASCYSKQQRRSSGVHFSTFRDHHVYPAEIVLPHLSPNLVVMFIIFVTANLFVGLGRTDYHMPPPISTRSSQPPTCNDIQQSNADTFPAFFLLACAAKHACWRSWSDQSTVCIHIWLTVGAVSSHVHPHLTLTVIEEKIICVQSSKSEPECASLPLCSHTVVAMCSWSLI